MSPLRIPTLFILIAPKSDPEMVFPQNWGFPSLLLTTCFANYKSQVSAHHCQANVSLMDLLSCSPLCQISHLSCSTTLFIDASDVFFIHSFNKYLLCPYPVERKTVHMDFFFLKLGETKNRNGNHNMENEVKRRISLDKYSLQTNVFNESADLVCICLPTFSLAARSNQEGTRRSRALWILPPFRFSRTLLPRVSSISPDSSNFHCYMIP